MKRRNVVAAVQALLLLSLCVSTLLTGEPGCTAVEGGGVVRIEGFVAGGLRYDRLLRLLIVGRAGDAGTVAVSEALVSGRAG